MTNKRNKKKEYLQIILFLFLIAIIFIYLISYIQNKDFNFNILKKEGAATNLISSSLGSNTGLSSDSSSGRSSQNFNTHNNSKPPNTNLRDNNPNLRCENPRNYCSINATTTEDLEELGSTIDNPIIICSAEQFNDIRKGLDKHYVLGSDIDLSNYSGGVFGWDPIGTEENRFFGSLDGADHKILNLNSNRNSISALFGYATNAEFKNIILENININSQSGAGVAGLVFDLYDGNIYNVSVNGQIYSVGSAAGLAHTIENTNINNCSFIGSIASESINVGGLIGFSDSSNINNSYTNISEIKGIGKIGGLIGKALNSTIFNSYSIGGEITSKATEEGVGGLIGNGEKINVHNCFSTNNIIIQKEYSNNKNVGGLIGIVNDQSNVSNCFSISNIKINNLYNESIGGLIGYNLGNITNCYSIGEINILNDYFNVGINEVGGFVGSNLGTIVNSYSLVKINLDITNSVYNVGGLIGVSEYLENSYWDIDRSGIKEGIKQYGQYNYGEGKESQFLKKKETFQNWDFRNTWAIDSSNFGYPYLKSTASLLFLPDCYELEGVSFNYESGVYYDELSLVLSYNNNNNPYCNQVIIKYTTDGTTPTISSLTYNSPITLSSDTIVKARVFSQDLCLKEVEGPITTKEYEFDLTADMPTANPPPGEYDFPILVILNTSTEGAQIIYSINGSSRQAYTKPIEITSTTNLIAVASKPGWNMSEELDATYIINNRPFIAMPFAVPGSGVYSSPQSVFLRTNTPNTVIKYKIRNEYNYATINSNEELNCDDYDLYVYQNNPLIIRQSQTILVIGCDSENPESTENQSQTKIVRYIFEKNNPYLEQISSPSEISENLTLGTGSESDPIIILTPEQLNNIRNGLDKHYIIGKDINLSPNQLEKENWYDSAKGWLPIGTKENPFTGTIDGANHKISNLYINRPNIDYVGLFGFVKNAEIRNINLNDVRIFGGGYTGSLLGSYFYSLYKYPSSFDNDKFLISNNSSNGYIFGYERTGGLIGHLENMNIINSNFSGSVISHSKYVGGLIGDHYSENFPIKIVDCHTNINQIKGGITPNNTSDLGNYGFIGGLVGSGKNIYNSSSKGGKIISESKYYIGGLAGAAENIFSSYSDNNITGGLEKIGGLVGFSYNITNSYSKGNINIDINLDDSFILNKYKNTDLDLIGGLSGKGSNIYNCYSENRIYIKKYGILDSIENKEETYYGSIKNIGGVCGDCYKIDNSYSGGLIDINSIDKNIENIGGMCGSLEISGISNSYSKTSINIEGANNQNVIKNVGGLIGFVGGSLNIENNYSISNINISGNYENIGGLIGLRTNPEINTVKSSYWDKETSKLSISAGGISKTNLQLKTKSTFVGWNFNEIWEINPSINSGYPYLRTNPPQ